MKCWKKRLISLLFVLTVATSMSTVGISAAGWHKTNGKWWYEVYDGYYYVNGIQFIDDRPYHFDAQGYLTVGWAQDYFGKWCYQDANGNMAKGWKKIGEEWYYFNRNGVMMTGKMDIDGQTYMLKPNGAMATGWYRDTVSRYYCGTDGAIWKNDIYEIDGKFYYLNSIGILEEGPQRVNGNLYYFDYATGEMKFGWIETGSGNRMYAREDGSIVCGKEKIDGKSCLFTENGILMEDY